MRALLKSDTTQVIHYLRTPARRPDLELLRLALQLQGLALQEPTVVLFRNHA